MLINNRWSVLKIKNPISTPLDFIDVITNYSSLELQYDFSLHTSTTNAAPGLCFDSSFPIFDYSLIDANLLVALTVTINDTGDTSGDISEKTGYAFLPFTLSRPPDTSTLTVSVSPSQGVALSTAFAINCSGGNTLLTPLSYSIGYLTGDAVHTNQSDRQSLASKCFWIIRKRTIIFLCYFQEYIYLLNACKM